MLWLLFLLFAVGCVEGECPGEDHSVAPRPYARPDNLSVCGKAYLWPNCTCPSGMFECACHKFGRCKGESGCLPMSKVNDGRNQCGDWSDEFGDFCPKGRFQCDCFNTTCKNLYGCVAGRERCNGYIGCLDGSDEVNCTCPDDQFQCDCYKTKSCILRQKCINKKLLCNGDNNCGDWSDEVNCTRPANRFECRCYQSKNCTSKRGWFTRGMRCDGYNNCGDWSDESNCPCPSNRFECDCFKTNNCTGGNCIGRKRICNGINNCGDWSDEVNCTCNKFFGFECSCYKTRNCTSKYGCLGKRKLCNGRDDCGDWSDELNCTYSADKFQCDCYKTKNCTNKYSIIPKSQKCDGREHCEDGSDEAYCTCPADQFECACVGTKQCDINMEGSCIDRSLLCDGNRDCLDGSDESQGTCNCTGVFARCPCDPGNKHCPSAGRCIPFHWLGDNLQDCTDGSDKACLYSDITCSSCKMHVTSCKSEQLARYLVHSTVPAKCNSVIQPSCVDNIKNCKTEKVICVTSECENYDEFCHNLFTCENQELILYNYFCDGINDLARDCNDTSDEINEGFGFKCSGSSRQGVCVLPQVNVYDSWAQCSDNSDLCFVNGEFRCFQCLDKKLIVSPRQVCDGVVDCFDMSDECLCPNQSLCDEIRGICPGNQMHCYNTSTCINQDQTLCNASVKCVDEINTKYCSFQGNPKQAQCLTENVNDFGLDKIFKCAKTDSIRLRDQLQYNLARGHDAQYLLDSICDGVYRDRLGPNGEINCPNTFKCFSSSGFTLKSSQVCDGKADCDDGSDEFFDLCHKTRYYCKSESRISISRKTVCDGIIDCDNESDENRCRCESKRFYCTNQQPLSVEWKLVQNGIHDCSDGSDECVNLAGDAFADVNEMIANPLYRGIFWMTAMFALGGNLFVFAATAHSLYNAKKDQNVFIHTSIFILNLSVSDFLMGIYLLAVILQGTQFSGSYCLFDKEWRSSSLCSGLGALAVISSEASAFTMTAMTTYRLVSVFKPFVVKSVGIGRILLAEMFCWILSIVLATTPLLKITSSYFVTDVWFPNYIFGSDFVSRENMSLLAERITSKKPDIWKNVKQTVFESFPRNTIKGEFGYYGETSVCMPRLFAKSSEFAWEYSTFLITINFLMFIYMVIAYVIIYKQSNRMKGSRSTDVSSRMQKRISRLILTDFCCWIPICIMGYLSVGGIKMQPDAYVLSACLLLPINSALNPLLYSKAIEDRVTKAKKYVLEKISSLRVAVNRSSNVAVIYNANVEEEDNRVVEIIE